MPDTHSTMLSSNASASHPTALPANATGHSLGARPECFGLPHERSRRQCSPRRQSRAEPP
jgi:hypothetical protein